MHVESSVSTGTSDDPAEDQGGNPQKSRLPRKVYRKERKKARRQLRRQQAAQERNRESGKTEEEPQDMKEHSEYLQQKRLWEEREKRYNLINIARRRAQEAERAAREAAEVKG